MNSLAAVFSMAAVAGCSTAAPLALAEVAPTVAVPVPVVAELQMDKLDIRAVHGRVEYRNGQLWSALRPNMVLSNSVQIRPGADSSFDLFGGDGVTMRLVSDHNQKIRAFVVHRGGVSEASAAARSSDGNSLRCSATAFAAGGRVRVDSGEMTLTGNGKTYLLRAGESFDAETDEVRSELQTNASPSATASPAEIVSAPRALAFDGGLENARRGLCALGE